MKNEQNLTDFIIRILGISHFPEGSSFVVPSPKIPRGVAVLCGQSILCISIEMFLFGGGLWDGHIFGFFGCFSEADGEAEGKRIIPDVTANLKAGFDSARAQLETGLALVDFCHCRLLLLLCAFADFSFVLLNSLHHNFLSHL